MYEYLVKEIETAKSSASRDLMFQTHGQIVMAFKLDAITKDQFIELDRKIIYEGINNPKFIKIWNEEYFETAE